MKKNEKNKLVESTIDLIRHFLFKKSYFSYPQFVQSVAATYPNPDPNRPVGQFLHDDARFNPFTFEYNPRPH